MRARFIGILAGVGLFVGPVAGDELSQVDVQELLDRLEELEGGASTRQVGRLGTAYQAFSSAIQSDGAAWDLYTKCVEKVNYEGADRSAKEFREWKRRSEDRLGPEFQRALRHELNWFCLLYTSPSPRDLSTSRMPSSA